MKKIINCILLSMLFLITLASCNKENLATGIYAPNGLLVSKSMTDLTKTVANAISLNPSDLSIKSISYLNVEQGFAAEIEIHISTTDEYTKVYYFSPLLKDKLSYDSSIEFPDGLEARGTVPFIEDAVAFCACGNDPTPSSDCRISGTLQSDYTISLTCYSEGCYSGCVFYAQ